MQYLFAQNFADKNYYLVDSLVLEEFDGSDKQLVDSCLKVYHKAKDDTSRINIVNQIVEGVQSDKVWPKYNQWVYLQVQNLLKNQHSILVTRQLQVSYASSLNNIGFIYYSDGDIPHALEYFHKGLTIQEKSGDKKGIALSLYNIGSIYELQGNVAQALVCFHKSLVIREKLSDKYGIASTLNNIGSIYDHQGNVPQALEYYRKSLTIYEEIDDKKGMSISLNNIGLVYHDQSNIQKSLEHHHKSLAIREELGDKHGIANSLNNIGMIYDYQSESSTKTPKDSLRWVDIPKALEYYHRSLAIREQIEDKEGITYSLNSIGGIELTAGLRGQSIAKKRFNRALNLAQELGYPALISLSSKSLSRVLELQGDYRKSLKMYKLHIQMKDSLNNEATQKASAQQQAKSEYEKQKAVDDAEHDKLLAIEKEAKTKQKVITVAIGVGFFLVVVFLVFVFNRLRVTRKQKVVIEQQRDEVEEAHKEIRDSINYAERIQHSFLATDELLNNNLKDYFVFFQPKDVVSGDFYWASKLSNNKFVMVNADSTGHGVPGAIMSILNISSIEKAIEKGLTKPSEIFNDTRDTIIERLSKDGSEEGGKDGMDASIISFDFENNKFSYTAAQNPIWVVRKRHCERFAKAKEGSNLTDDKIALSATLLRNDDYELIEIKPEKMPLGKHENDQIPFVGGEFETQKGDVVYTLTDGFQDQFGGKKGKKFKVKPFKDLLISIANLPMEEQRDKLKETFNYWKGEEEQVDDVCVMGVRI